MARRPPARRRPASLRRRHLREHPRRGHRRCSRRWRHCSRGPTCLAARPHSGDRWCCRGTCARRPGRLLRLRRTLHEAVVPKLVLPVVTTWRGGACTQEKKTGLVQKTASHTENKKPAVSCARVKNEFENVIEIRRPPCGAPRLRKVVWRTGASIFRMSPRNQLELK